VGNLCVVGWGLVDSSLGFGSPELRLSLQVAHGAFGLA
jgi:hypothetical protein